MKRYVVVRSSDGKGATQSRFFGPVSWGGGKLYQKREAAEKLLRDIECKVKNLNWDKFDKSVQNLGTLHIKEIDT